MYCKRLGKNSQFEFIVEKVIDFKKQKNTDLTKKITIKINKVIEGWIKKNPEQWFWVHNRWKNKDR